jgi:hypothetical protein
MTLYPLRGWVGVKPKVTIASQPIFPTAIAESGAIAQ